MVGDIALAYSTLALTVGLAVLRPRASAWFRFSPGSAALLGALVLLLTRVLSPADLLDSLRVQWRPLVTLSCIMLMTGLVQELKVFERVASVIEARARSRSGVYTFTVVFALSVVTPSLLNNDAAILLLTPLVVTLVRRLYPDQPALVIPFAFAVFLAPGVAPFIVSNPMNLIVAGYAGLDFNSYAATMVPISLGGASVTYLVLRRVFAHELRAATATQSPTPTVAAHRAERPAIILLCVVFAAYPIGAIYGVGLWAVAVAGAVGVFVLARAYRVAPAKTIASYISLDILFFVWGILVVVQGLKHVGLVDAVRTLYAAAAADSTRGLVTVGVTSALGSALIDNHPMSLINMLALDGAAHTRPLLAALIGGDIGPRLLPIGSLAGLLWIDLLRRQGVQIRLGQFVRLGTIVLIPTLALSLWMICVIP